MSDHGWLLLSWIVLLVACWPYVQRIRHPGMAPLAAYLIFVCTFSALAAVLFGMLAALAAASGSMAMLDRPAGISVFLALGFAPGLVMARWLIQRPLRRMPLPGE